MLKGILTRLFNKVMSVQAFVDVFCEVLSLKYRRILIFIDV